MSTDGRNSARSQDGGAVMSMDGRYSARSQDGGAVMPMDGRYKGEAGAIAEQQRSGAPNREAPEQLKQASPGNVEQVVVVPSGVAERLKKTKKWLAEAVDNHYSIQLFLARMSKADKVEAFLQGAPETLDFTRIYIYETVINGQEWYSVLYNEFVTHSEAIESLDSLPLSLKASGAYLRRIRALKKDKTHNE